MRRQRIAILGLCLAALAACGGTTATAPAQPLAAPTATVAPSNAPPTTTGAPTGAAPRATTASPAGAASPTTAAARPTTGRAPGGTPAASGIPASPAAAPAGPTAVPQPRGAIPAGWQVYRGGPEFPFVIAYPPDWTADDSLLPDQRIVYFHGPGDRELGERIDLEISEVGDGAGIDVQRDEFFTRESAFCDAKGIEYTTHRQVAGVPFAILGATCDASNVLSFMQVASGLVGGDEWNILMRTPYERKAQRLRDVFDPMLASLNVYAPIP
jgi:hypothetical protein